MWGSSEGIRRRRARLLWRGSTDGGQDHGDELRRQAEYGAVREREESVRERTREEERERVRAFYRGRGERNGDRCFMAAIDTALKFHLRTEKRMHRSFLKTDDTDDEVIGSDTVGWAGPFGLSCHGCWLLRLRAGARRVVTGRSDLGSCGRLGSWARAPWAVGAGARARARSAPGGDALGGVRSGWGGLDGALALGRAGRGGEEQQHTARTTEERLELGDEEAPDVWVVFELAAILDRPSDD